MVATERSKLIGDVGQPNILLTLSSFLLQLPSRTGLNRELKLEVLKEAAQLGTIHILRYHFYGGNGNICTYFQYHIDA